MTISRSWASIPITLSNLTLANTLPVGQSFLWHRYPIEHEEASEEFSRAVDDPPRVVRLRQTPTHLLYAAVYPDASAERLDVDYIRTRQWIHNYFQLDHDLDQLYKEWKERDPGLFGKIDIDGRAVGVRLLRQDPWECLLAFITSTNNHISRITSLMHRFSQTYSPPLLTHEDRTYHLFPAPHSIPAVLETELRTMGFGYRASFIESSLATLRKELGDKPGNIEAGLLRWRTTEALEVREKLLGLKGVGRKVADCVMLMCLDQLALIPVDTHVAAIAARHPSFPSRLKHKTMSKQVYEETQDFLADKWGELGGWAQAVMFAADLKPASTTPKKTAVKSEWRSPASPTSPASPAGIKSPASVYDGSPLKRKAEGGELKRTRSATRTSLRRTESDLVVDDVEEKLNL